MKLKLFTSSLLVFLFFTNSVLGQKLSKKDVLEKITRSWTAVETGNSVDEMTPKQSVEVIVFSADGSFTMKQESNMMGVMNMVGEWDFDKKSKELILKMEMDGHTENVLMNILTLTESRLVLASKNRVVAYIPTQRDASEIGVVSVSVAPVEEKAELNPENWTGGLAYNLVFLMDDSDEQIEEQKQGVITLTADGENKVITKVEGEVTLTWTVMGEMTIAGNTRYDVKCSDSKYNGEITFQNGFLMLEVYEPSYMSYYFVKK